MFSTEKIRQLLSPKLSVQHLEIFDDSSRHAGHAEARKSGGGHFTVVIVSEDFEGKPLLKRHRLVYDILKGYLKADIHALGLKTLTPAEFQRSDQS